MKNNNSLLFNINRENESLKIDIQSPQDSIWHQEKIDVSIKKVELQYQKLVSILNKQSGNNTYGNDTLENLKKTGRMMCDELLTPDIKETLRKTKAEFLTITIDDHLVHIPWELLCIEDKFFCESFNMGRLVKTRKKISGINNRSLENPLKMWILANPNGDLPNAGQEGLMLTKQMYLADNAVEAVQDSEIMPDKVKKELKDYDIVHFAGHAEYNSDSPENSSWKLKNGYFTAQDISKMAGGDSMPSLVFSNACQSARTDSWKQNGADHYNHSFGLVDAFMCSGVKHYIGTSWKIPDEPGSRFAGKFYEYLLAGYCVGEAVRLARISLMKDKDALCWTSYLLYGDPAFVYYPQKKRKISQEPLNKNIKEESGSDKKRATSEESRKKVHIDPVPERKKPRNSYIWQIVGIICLIILAAGVKFALKNGESQAPDKITLSVAIKNRPKGKENFIAHMIEGRIIQSLPWMTLLERTSLDLLLKEYELIESRLVPKKNKIDVEFLAVDFYLIIEVDTSDSKPFVLMRLADQRTTEIIKLFDEPIDSEKLIKDQIEEISENLLTTLKKECQLK
ncbi:CHAT domain-containing protein [Desulfobacterales bacterium HSG16]|nr:CHAT domain-containing protein [Desulfobacterales bacterium HSG16]